MGGDGVWWQYGPITSPAWPAMQTPGQRGWKGCGGSAMLMLPEEETVLRSCGDSSRDTISAPWSVRALACSRNISLCDSIWEKEIYMN